MAPKDDMKTQFLEQKIDAVQDDVKEIKTVLQGNYVTRIEFDPVKSVVYSLVGLIMVGVVGALLALVLKQ